MNTLNFKVLLIKETFVLFMRAIGVYLLATLPALAALPVMYEMSALYAIGFGWIAAFLFLGFFYLLQKINAATRIKQSLLYVSVVVAVGIAFQMMEVMGAQDHIWQSGLFLLFPLAAVISGWISLALSKHKVRILFNQNEFTQHISPSSNPENI